MDKAIAAIAEASANGAKLIVFPEAFIPGYPEWVWMNAPGKKSLTILCMKSCWNNRYQSAIIPQRDSAMRHAIRGYSWSWASMNGTQKPAMAAFTIRFYI